ncbi:MAG TPA: radical SAM protein [bacterium]|nr:radical SAM protein [bacterium]
MKVLFINPTIREWAAPNCFPSGLGYMAATLTDAGHEVEIYDMNALRPSREDRLKFFEKADYDIAGVGGIITVYKNIKSVVSELKAAHPDRPVIMGGSCATSSPEVMMNNTPVDFLCVGEGEETIVELANNLERGGDVSSIAGLWRREDGAVVANKPRSPIADLDSLPFPKWELFPMDVYCRNPIGAVNVNKWVDGGAGGGDIPRSMNLTPSRGCAYKCIFCYHDFMGAGFRRRRAAGIFEEIMALKERFDVKYFHFTDDCFITDRKNVLDFCDLLMRENAGIEWGCAGRANLMTEPLIARMREAGCVLLGYGIESGSPRILKNIKKQVTVEQARNAIKLTQKYMGWADCSLIAGLPGETRETVRETIDFCKSCDLNPEVIFFATPYPGTELFNIAMREGKIPDMEKFLLSLGEQGEQILVNFTDFSDEELRKIKESMVVELNAWNKISHGKPQE